MPPVQDQASSLRTEWVGTARNERKGGRSSSLGATGTTDTRTPDPPASRVPERSTAPLLAITSGKGGVGKTFLAVNLSLAMRAMGYRPLLVDLDWGLANVDVALGLAPARHLGHVVAGECSLAEAMIDHEGIAVVPNGCGQSELATLEAGSRSALIRQIERSPDQDIALLDTHPGISPLTMEAAREASAVLVVSTPEPTALTDTYALFKVLGEGRTRGPAGLVINQAGSPDQAYEAARHLDSVARRFLGYGITCWGYVLQDTAVPRSVRQQRALLKVAPRSEAARLVRQAARTIVALLDPAGGDASAGVRAASDRLPAGTARNERQGRPG